MELDPITTQLIQIALAEDIGSGDVTARYFIPEDAATTATIFAKEDGIASGALIAAAVFSAVDPTLDVTVLVDEGNPIPSGSPLLRATGSTRSLVTAERTALNFFARLCGIATLTRRYVDAVEGTGARVLDTRKTTPGWRHLEKAAVRAGGGQNHRMGLYDRVMVKDNHLLAEAASTALQAAVTTIKSDEPDILIELEADTLDQVSAFLDLDGIDIILLDNMPLDTMRKAVSMNAGRVALEASGNVTLETIRAIAETGVDFISSGALTHAARSLDLSLTLGVER